jgi:hypothetical protein
MVEAGIKSGLERAGLPKFDLLGFDACLMGSVELVVQLAPYTRYYIASELVEPGTGWDWTSLRSLNANPSKGPLEFATDMAEGYFKDPKSKKRTLTMQVTDIAAVASFRDALESFAQALTTALADLSIMTALHAAVGAVYRDEDFADFGQLLQLLRADERLEGRGDLKELINITLRAYSSAMAYNKRSDELTGLRHCCRVRRPSDLYLCVADVTGLSVWFPTDQDGYQKYRRDYVALPVLPKWKLAVRTLFESTKPSTITLARSRSASSAGSVSQQAPSFSSSETPYIEVGTDGLTYVATLSSDTAALVSSAALWYGVKYSDQLGVDSVVWFGQRPAKIGGTLVSA